MDLIYSVLYTLLFFSENGFFLLVNLQSRILYLPGKSPKYVDGIVFAAFLLVMGVIPKIYPKGPASRYHSVVAK